jgi:hypothetical protein
MMLAEQRTSKPALEAAAQVIRLTLLLVSPSVVLLWLLHGGLHRWSTSAPMGTTVRLTSVSRRMPFPRRFAP